MGKLSKMLYMIDLLNTGNVYSLKELSEKLGITERMVRYYKEEICSNGIAIDFNLFFDYIYALCFSSPYSWKDDEWKNENGWVDYRDSIGVFDVNRRKIIEYLVKNHDFKENSEVGEYKRRLLK